MPLLSVRDKEAVDELTRELVRWTDDGRSALQTFVPQFHALMGFEKSLSFQLAETANGLHISTAHSLGIPSACLVEFRALLASRPVSWLGYNPLVPPPVQRNRIVGWPKLRQLVPTIEETPMAAMQRRYQVPVREQIRTFVCEGPSLLAWVGGYRSERFTRRDHAIFAALVPALRPRLALERQLEGVRLMSAALSAHLDHVGTAIFIVTEQGVIKHANLVGRSFLDNDRRLVADAMSAICEGRQPGRGWSVTTLAIAGLPPHYLLSYHADPADVTSHLAAAVARWSLSDAEAKVLALVVMGEANKTISSIVSRSIATIEFHVTSLLRKSGCESRAALVACFWRGSK